jgi:hypothetical protein
MNLLEANTELQVLADRQLDEAQVQLLVLGLLDRGVRCGSELVESEKRLADLKECSRRFARRVVAMVERTAVQ